MDGGPLSLITYDFCLAHDTQNKNSMLVSCHRFDCCLPTHKFHTKQSDHKTSHPRPHKPAKVHHDIKPVASVQRVPIPKLFALPAPTEPEAQEPQQSPYAGYQYQDAASPVGPTAGG